MTSTLLYEHFKKKYNVSISYSQADSEIARDIQLFTQEEFRREFMTFLAVDDTKSGDIWKETTKKIITIGNAIISLAAQISNIYHY